MEGKLESKSGLLELIEMSNKRKANLNFKASDGTILRNNSDAGDHSGEDCQRKPIDFTDQEESNQNQMQADEDDNEPINNASSGDQTLEGGRRILRKTSNAARTNAFWSTMRALSNDDNKKFSAFSGPNSSNENSKDPLNFANSRLNSAESDSKSKPTMKPTDNGQTLEDDSENAGVDPLLDIADPSDADRELESGNQPLVDERNNDNAESEPNHDIPMDDVQDTGESQEASNQEKDLAPADPNIWVLPADKDVCTLEEIRRGQVINKVDSNVCPVMGCGKKINEMRADPSPGTIASGLRTHVLFVHYETRKGLKKKKLGWTKKRYQVSPRKQDLSSPSTSRQEMSGLDPFKTDPGINLIQRCAGIQQGSSGLSAASMVNKRLKQLSRAQQQNPPMSSLQSLIQATSTASGGAVAKHSNSLLTTKNQDSRSFSDATSSLFSILAGITQQQTNQPTANQPPLPRNLKTTQNAGTMNVPQCSRSTTSNSPVSSAPGRNVSSSLMSLLNEKISGDVANSLERQLKKTIGSESTGKIKNASRRNLSSPTNYFSQQQVTPTNNGNSFNHSATSLLNNLCQPTGNGVDNRSSFDNSSISLNTFIEAIAVKTGSNIGPAGIAEARKMIEKFTTSLICSSQTIADHYVSPYVGEAPQQKPEISPSDIVLSYKMMQKSHGQP